MDWPTDNNLSLSHTSSQWTASLLAMDRRTIATVILTLLFLVILFAGWCIPADTGDVRVASDPIETLNQALLTASVTGVTLVLTISQLVLSQELGAVGDRAFVRPRATSSATTASTTQRRSSISSRCLVWLASTSRRCSSSGSSRVSLDGSWR